MLLAHTSGAELWTAIGTMVLAVAAIAAGIVAWLGFRKQSGQLRILEEDRRQAHRSLMWDDALKVTAEVGQGSDYVSVEQADGGRQMKAVTKVIVTVTNAARRQITDVRVRVITRAGDEFGTGMVEFLQAGRSALFQFDAVEGAWSRRGASPVIDVAVEMVFVGLDGTVWIRDPDGALTSRPGGLNAGVVQQIWQKQSGQGDASPPS